MWFLFTDIAQQMFILGVVFIPIKSLIEICPAKQ